MPKSYIETCREVVSTVDVEALASLPLGNALGRGSRFEFRQLGKLIVATMGEQHVGIKVPTKNRQEAVTRLRQELVFINLTLNASPELTTNMPAFMALVRLERESEPLGILTEDVSWGGIKKVREMQTSNRVRELIYAPFSELGSMDEVLNEDECDDTLAFDVDGEEKLLDFTPPPINKLFLHSSAAYANALFKVVNLMPELTITLPRDSVLGEALV